MKFNFAFGLIGLLSTSAAADAQSPFQNGGDWYVSGAVTAGRLDDASQTVANAPAPGSTLRLTNEIETDWGGQIALGRTFGSLRAEIEYGQQDNGSDSYSTVSPFVATLPQEGSTEIKRLMVNAYFDFLSEAAAIRPYVGAGAGTAEVSMLRINATALAPTAPPQRRVDFSDSGFAWQAMAGVSWRVAPSVALTAQYRWFDRGDVEGKDIRGERVVIGVATHNIDLGLRYSF